MRDFAVAMVGDLCFSWVHDTRDFAQSFEALAKNGNLIASRPYRAHTRRLRFAICLTSVPRVSILAKNEILSMNPRKLKAQNRWRATRKKGKTKFILLTGVLSWGFPMFILMTFFIHRRQNDVLSPAGILISAIIWLLAGALFGWVMWTVSEKSYQKHLAALRSNETPESDSGGDSIPKSSG
ncbi:MAG: hypothetical protein JJU00_11305 [Opitutales bacterium]|nr:hypothetical protein [Opitutales bacterium]